MPKTAKTACAAACLFLITVCSTYAQTIGTTSYGQWTSIAIPDYDGRVASLRLFESGHDMPSKGYRTYVTSFDMAKTRYVAAELSVDMPAARLQSQKIEVPCRFLTASGSVVGNPRALNLTPDAGATNVSDATGWGTETPGWWKPGIYRIECSYGGRVIAQAPFTVLAAPDIPEYEGRATTLQLFESGKTTPRQGQRRYVDRFDTTKTRYVNFELTVELPKASHQDAEKTFVSCEFVDAAGASAGNPPPLNMTPPDYATTILNTTGWGKELPGSWKPGAYRVQCRYGGRVIAQAPFTILPGADIPEYEGRVTDLRIFESGKTILPREQRIYGDRFDVTQTRYLDFELGIKLPPASQQSSKIMVPCRFLNVRGESVGNPALLDMTPAPGATSIFKASGWGADAPGWWQPGDYRAECSYGGKVIARAAFAVVRASDIPVYDGRVIAIRMFESAKTPPPASDRKYADGFDDAKTRYVNIELTVGLPAAAQQSTKTEVPCRIVDALGKVVATPPAMDMTPNKGSTSVYNSIGWGSEKPGSWKPGVYRAECTYGGRVIAEAPFTVTQSDCPFCRF